MKLTPVSENQWQRRGIAVVLATWSMDGLVLRTGKRQLFNAHQNMLEAS